MGFASFDPSQSPGGGKVQDENQVGFRGESLVAATLACEAKFLAEDKHPITLNSSVKAIIVPRLWLRKPGSLCVTSAMKGCFRNKSSTRAELMTLIYGDRR